MIKGTENIPVGDLISRRVPFVIPRYQRGYAWGTDEINDFIGDMQMLYKLRQQHDKQLKRHFFGGLVSVDRFAAATVTGRVFEVVDGQQRLATFMIVMALITDALTNVALQAKQLQESSVQNEATAHALQTRSGFLIYQEVEQGQLRDRLRLRLSKVDHTFFEKLLISDLKPSPEKGQDSHRKLYAAYKAVHKQLLEEILEDSSLTVKDKLTRLLVLRTCITDDCHVIFIVGDDRYEAYHLFTTLNDRGRSLSNGDLLRSTTLELLEGQELKQDHVETLWQGILSKGTPQVDSFLHSYYISFEGMRAPKKDLFDFFRRKFFDYMVVPPKLGVSDGEASTIEERIANMAHLAKVFDKLSMGEWPYDPNPAISDWKRDRLHRLLKVLQHTLCLPLLLAVYNRLNENNFVDLVLLLERFIFRYITISGAHEGKVAEIYYRYCVNIRTDPTSYSLSDLESELRSLAQISAPDSVFEANLVARLTYSDSSPEKRRIKHFLTTIEDHHTWFINGAPGRPQPNPMSAWDLNQVTIEHIYPQNPKTTEIDPELEPHKQEISNLSFWAAGDNRSASNDTFADKRFRYEKSTVMMNQDLARLAKWDLSTLKERHKHLVKKAKRLYSI